MGLERLVRFIRDVSDGHLSDGIGSAVHRATQASIKTRYLYEQQNKSSERVTSLSKTKRVPCFSVGGRSNEDGSHSHSTLHKKESSKELIIRTRIIRTRSETRNSRSILLLS